MANSTKTREQRIAELEQKKAQLDARIQREKARIRQNERKEDTRRKIVAGAIVLEHAQKDARFREVLNNLLDNFATRPEDRKLFDLPSK